MKKARTSLADAVRQARTGRELCRSGHFHSLSAGGAVECRVTSLLLCGRPAQITKQPRLIRGGSGHSSILCVVGDDLPASGPDIGLDSMRASVAGCTQRNQIKLRIFTRATAELPVVDIQI
jgi:hypothetical protein